MWLAIWIGVGLYAIGFCFAFWLNVMMGNITLGLVVVRSVLWPLWLGSRGRLLQGESEGPD